MTATSTDRPTPPTTVGFADVVTTARAALARGSGGTHGAVIAVLGTMIAVGQVLVLGVMASRGYWYADDLDNLATARGQDLDLGYLTLRLNDHLVPGLRLVYWVFANVAPLDWTFTVVFRMLVQLLATLLLLRLLVALFGRRRLVLLMLLAYASSPLLLPSFMSLSSGVNIIPSQAAGLGLLLLLVRWRLQGGWLPLLGMALCLTVSISFWEKSGLILLSAVLLALGPLRQRDGVTWPLRSWWPPVAALSVPVVGFGSLYLSSGGTSSGSWPGLGTEIVLVLQALWLVVAPAAVAGPWEWMPAQPAPFGLAEPPLTASLLGAAVLLLLGYLAARRHRRTLLGWGLVLAWVVATVVSVSIGRLETFGTTFLGHYHYWSDLSILLVLTVTWCATVIVDGAATTTGATTTGATTTGATTDDVTTDDVTAAGTGGADSDQPAAATSGGATDTAATDRRNRLLALGLATWLVACVASHAGFAQLWANNPSRAWLQTAEAHIRSWGSPVNLYDTPVPVDVLNLFADRRQVSDILSLTDLPVVFDQAETTPMVLNDKGALKEADFQVWATGAAGSEGCGHLLQGSAEVTIPLDKPLPTGQWFLRIGYLANPDAPVSVKLFEGDTAHPMAGETPSWPAGLNTQILQTTELVRGDRVVVTGLDNDVNICIGEVTVGLPVARP